MGKHNIVSGIIVLAVLLMIAISTLIVVAYTTGVISSAVDFASTDQVAKLSACGVAIPAQLFQLRADIPNIILPLIYVGFPALMVIIALLMYLAGYYHSSGEHSTSETTTTTTSNKNRSKNSGRYAKGKHIDTRTQKSSRSEEN